MKDVDRFRFSIDKGGTFTDIYAEIPGRSGGRVLKLLSEDPDRYSDAVNEGIRRIFYEAGVEFSSSQEQIEWVRMGTTLVTNALIERKGARCALVVTRGFRDLLRIGKQDRPHIFDLVITKPPPVYEAVLEVDERTRYLGEGKFEVLKDPDLKSLEPQLVELKNRGIESLAVLCMHSWGFPDHELSVGELAKNIGFEFVILSHQSSPRVNLVERGHTVCVDAYLNPVLKNYLKNFRDGFSEVGVPKTLFMGSHGGLVEADDLAGSRSILSGPAGGVVGYSRTAEQYYSGLPVIGFDMGGTSTDVSRFEKEFEWTHETETAGVYIQAPRLDIHTVAAGGGSRLFFRNGLFTVGPESSGANPGPVCYGKNGFLSLTDANLLLGRILPDFFPRLFGPEGDAPLDAFLSRESFISLVDEINSFCRSRGEGVMSVEEAALGFVRVANETMAQAVRDITVARGWDARKHILACFGGAGGQHACAVARSLGIRKIFIHRNAGILSAYGISLACEAEERREPAFVPFEKLYLLKDRLDNLEAEAKNAMKLRKISLEKVDIKRYLNLRYEGTDTARMVEAGDSSAENFRNLYLKEFGFSLDGRIVWIDDIRVRITSFPSKIHNHSLPAKSTPSRPTTMTRCYFDSGWKEIPVYRIEEMGPGECVDGPALFIQPNSTIVVEPFSRLRITLFGDLEIELLEQRESRSKEKFDPVQLSLFSNRFMSIAEQMGSTLQRTAVSTNIKERRDFSCAIFDTEGNLVANAPHLPVHLGAMGEAVRQQIAIQANNAQPGDVWVTNHPEYGGSHLPDITVITPVFHKEHPVFYVANRGHHADIGGLSPGSMPPFSKSLAEEGVCIKSLKLVDQGVFQQQKIIALLTGKIVDGPGTPMGKGTRTLEDNLSDLKAQVFANHRGAELLIELTKRYSLLVVVNYMTYIRNNAENAVRTLIKSWDSPDKIQAEEFMDDGTPIRLKLTLDKVLGEAIFDFTGTGVFSSGNINAPRAVTISSILYCLRCLVDMDIPLNQGCLVPVRVIIPPRSLLSPPENAAVCGGNVLTSQRVTDLILKAFGAAAASQGCMNNITFGNDRFVYYETVGGGAGAGPGWNGQSGVQTHMTNTRITDPEVLETLYPVLLREFSIREGSGGQGAYYGGNGMIREIEFLEYMSMAILSERRTRAPFGLAGGNSGAKGKNFLIKKEGEIVSLLGKSQIQVRPGDRLRVMTPGGGGYGKVC